jgi:membrane protein
MGISTGPTTTTLKATVEKVRARNLTFLAGSLAYNAFVSLIPLLLLVLLVAGRVGDERLADRIGEVTSEYLTLNGQNLVTDAVTNTSGQTGLSIVGVLVLLWGALKLFRGLDTAFATVYGETDDLSLLDQLRDGFIAFLSVTVSLLVVGLAGGAFAYFDLPLLHLLNPVLLLVGLSLAFLPMYYVYPNVETSVGTVLPGAVLAAGGWALLEVGFQVYAANAARYEAYGVIGGILLLITWLYFSGLVLLVGAALNAVLWEQATTAGHLGSGDAPRATSTAIESDSKPADATPVPAPSTTPASDRDRRSESTARTGAAATGVADVTPMGARPAPEPEPAPSRDSGQSVLTLPAFFFVGVLVGIGGSVVALVAIWNR